MSNEKSFAVIIPARYESSRFPGKPLVDICGKPMIRHVWERCCHAVGQHKVYVATDDIRIRSVVESFGGQVVMTSTECLTGTDRVAEANLQLNCDFIVNVQGDEPLINPNDINTVIEAFLKSGNVTNAMCAITSEQEFRSFTVPKVTFSQSGKLLYMSRAGIPQTKTGEYKFGYKQVCIYAFSKDQLEFFYSNKVKTRHEKIEDIEILRFLESDYIVDMVEVAFGSLAVDTPQDIKPVL
ncbi:3-deoxy-manno-octulosonate cytidylyltransferase, partial [Vibrio cholerae]|nr:3-deoxy-manno-octulosonate cytidylyltransferase [Vibrio cholerae]